MSNEIKRLMPIHSAAYDKVVMTESLSGDYVEYEDYLHLRNEYEKLKRLEGVVICDSDGNTLDWDIVEGVVEISACEDDK